MGHLPVHLLARLAHRAHDESLADEPIGDFYALIEQAAWVVADIEDEPFEAAGFLGLFLEVLQTLQHLGVGHGREDAHFDVAVAIGE